MLKLPTSILFICSLFTASCSSVHAGDYNFDFRSGFVVTALGGIAVGGAATLALLKSYKWACNEQGPKKYIGRTVLGATGIGAILGFGYFMGYASKR